MKLSKDQKASLQGLINHPGFKIVQLIEEEARNNLGQAILTTDLSDEKSLALIKENQTYVKARKDFLQNIMTNTSEIYNPVNSLLS